MVITCCGPKLPAPSVFSYQAILSSSESGEHVQIAVAVQVRGVHRTAASASVVITCCGPKLPAPSVFSYQAILSSSRMRRAHQVAIPVQVRGVDRTGPSRAR